MSIADPLIQPDRWSALTRPRRHLPADVRPGLPMAPGRPARHDPEHMRGGVVNCFLVTAPLQGWRHVRVSSQRTRVDWAHCVRELVDVHYPEAETIMLVMDQLNMHTPASLYAAFPLTEAKRIAAPKHGSWLNMVELELSVLQRQCLRQRFADRPTME